MKMGVGSKSGGKRLGAVSVLKRPLFTVVTAVFNGSERLESTILSVLSQKCDDVEHVIIDGGSTDGTIQTLRKYNNSVDYWLSEPDQGVYDAFNKACRLIRGRWTIFLGAGDQFYDANVLTSMSEVVQDVCLETEIV